MVNHELTLDELKWKPLSERRTDFVASLMYKHYKYNITILFQKMFHDISNPRSAIQKSFGLCCFKAQLIATFPAFSFINGFNNFKVTINNY